MLPIESLLRESISHAPGYTGRCLLLEFSIDHIGKYLIMLVTVGAESRVGGDAVFVEDAEGAVRLVARIMEARMLQGQSRMLQGGYG